MIRLDTTEFIKLVPSETNLDEMVKEVPLSSLNFRIVVHEGCSRRVHAFIWREVADHLFEIPRATKAANRALNKK